MYPENENRAHLAEGGAVSKLSMLGGSDTSEFTATAHPAQVMPTPRTWSTAIGETSKAAARKVRSTSSDLCRAILSYIRENGPASPEELRTALVVLGFGQTINTYRARTSDMAHVGLLTDSGERGFSEAGSRVIRWALAPASGSEVSE